MLIASTFLLWIVVALLVVAVVALARQIGVLHERIAPMGALVADGGPKAGDLAPHVHAETLDGQPFLIGAGHMGPRSTLLLFVAPDCPVCKKVIPLARTMAASESIDLVYVGDGDPAEQRAMIARHNMADRPFVNSAAIGLAFQIGKLPSAVLIRPDGVIAGKGLVNSREHLESLVVADETGFPTAQAYLRQIRQDGIAA